MVTRVEAEHATVFQDLLLCAEGLEAYLAELAVLAVSIAGAAEVRGCSIVIERPRRQRVAGDSDARAARMAEPVFAAGGPGAEAITEGTSVVVTDAWTETRGGAFPGTAAEEGLRSMAAVPFALEDGARGVLCFYSPRQHLFQPGKILARFLEIFLQNHPVGHHRHRQQLLFCLDARLFGGGGAVAGK